ncbi:signal peptidase II [Clostridium sp. UBA4548]|uniref:signal peptidase II n=1 Tax=Clostridium sp. UBA4548 TaxID=1946361 RepID=UPI0025C2E983|nr:signal peptidase II [Clostridium sp. UBA4548]
MLLEVVIIVLGLLLDRISKLWALSTLKDSLGITIIKNFFAFEYLENRGAAFGILQNKLWLLVVITILVASGMIFYLIKFKPSSKLLRISIAMIVSGAIGNLIDRIYYNFVVDFILVHYKEAYYFPTFNVADILVSVGTFFLIICILKDEI